MQKKLCFDKKVGLVFFVLTTFTCLLFGYSIVSQRILTTQTTTDTRAAKPLSSQQPNPASPIIRGTVAGENDFPYFSKIEASPLYGQKEVCGGALISENYIVTAAHCVNSVYQSGGTISVVIGVTNYSGNFSGRYIGHVEHSLSKGLDNVYVPVQYNETDSENNTKELYDIALVRLSPPATDIPTLSIPDLSVLDTKNFPEILFYKDNATFMGIGLTSEDEKEPSKLLMYADISLKDHKYYTGKYHNYSRIINSAQNWFNYFKPGVCNGDSGGPVILKKDQKLYYIGVIRGGVGVSCKNKINVSSSIAFHSKWIRETAEKYGYPILPDTGTATVGEYNPTNNPKKPLNMTCYTQDSAKKENCERNSVVCKWSAPPTPSADNLINLTNANISGSCIGR